MENFRNLKEKGIEYAPQFLDLIFFDFANLVLLGPKNYLVTMTIS